MSILLIGTGALLLVTLLLAVLVWAVVPRARRASRRYWKRCGVLHLVLLVVHLFGTMPLVLGWIGSRMVQTRGDESAYSGPRIGPEGDWLLQSRDSLGAERAGRAVRAELTAAAARTRIEIEAGDGVRLRGFVVPPQLGEPRCTVVMVHGLFRGALELEPVASMLRDLGAEVLLLELRNHGGSERRPASYGLFESRDVVAAVRWVRARPAHGDRPVVLFGVSLGTAAVSLAAVQVHDLGGLVLDAPMMDLTRTAHRMLTRTGRRSFGMPQPFRSMVLSSIELWSGFSFDDVRPGEVLRRLDPKVPVLLIGGSEDQRMVPDDVRDLYDLLPTREARRRLWIRPGSGHATVWTDDPDGYRLHLRDFLALVDQTR